jgi:hypothetical protein
VDSPSANSTVYESGVNRQFTAQDGVWVISFGHNGTTGATLSQTFDTVAGASYSVNYRVSRIQAGASELSAAVEAFDATSSQSLAKFAFAIPAANNTWVAGPTLTFTATSSSTVLQFRDTTVGGFDANWALDNVRFGQGGATPTPTPSKTLPKGKLGTTYFGANQHGKVMRFTALVTDAAPASRSASRRPPLRLRRQLAGSAEWLCRSHDPRLLVREFKGLFTELNELPVAERRLLPRRRLCSRIRGQHFGRRRPIQSRLGTPVAGPVELRVRNGYVAANDPLEFRATVSNDPSGSDTRVRLQSSHTPGDEASWADFSNSTAGRLCKLRQANTPARRLTIRPAKCCISVRSLRARATAIAYRILSGRTT